MANELLELALDELPDAFRRTSGTAVDKVREYVKFSSGQSKELMHCYGILPDSLNRPLLERIKLLLSRAEDESQIAVKLRNRLEEISPGSSSDI